MPDRCTEFLKSNVPTEQGAYHKWGEAEEDKCKLLVYRPEFGTHPTEQLSSALDRNG